MKTTFTRFPLKEQTLFAKRLSFLIKAGVPMVSSLDLIRTQTKSKAKAHVFASLVADVSSGQNLATALSKHGRLFGDFSINLIRVGEASGNLSQNLAYLAIELQKKQALRRKVMGALLYPLFITVATLGVTGALTAYIFPKLMPIFTSLGVELPLITRVLITVSAFLRDDGVYTILGLIVLFIATYIIRRRFERFRYGMDAVILHVPLMGTIARSYNLANFCRTYGLLLRSGVSVVESMDITAQTQNNAVYRVALTQSAESTIRGESISRSLSRRSDIFPDLLLHMIAVGETTGNLEDSLQYLADMYEAEVEELTKSLSSSIEPALMVVMGALVGLIAVSVITPIYSITQHLQPK